jgi:hypothetical protein
VLGNSINAMTDFNTYYLYYNSTPSIFNFGGKALSVTPSKSAAACSSLLNVLVSTGISPGTSTSTSTGPTGHGSTLMTGDRSTKPSPTSIISTMENPPAGHFSFSKPFSFMDRVRGFMYLIWWLLVVGFYI